MKDTFYDDIDEDVVVIVDEDDLEEEHYENPLLEQYLLGNKEIKKPKFDEEDEEIPRIENNDIDILSKYNLDSSVDEEYKETTQNNDIENEHELDDAQNILGDNYIDYQLSLNANVDCVLMTMAKRDFKDKMPHPKKFLSTMDELYLEVKANENN